jgi:hypothetical protein
VGHPGAALPLEVGRGGAAPGQTHAGDLPRDHRHHGRKSSACNQFCQTWDHKNLFLTDGASFASNADKNPTLSIMAIAWRATEYMAAEAKKGNL